MFFPGTDAFSNGTKRRNYLVAFLSGMITGIAWWIIIDILARSTEILFARVYIIPGAIISLMLIILHFIPEPALQDEHGIFNVYNSSSTVCDGVKCARFFLFIIFLLIFSGVIASVWIFIADYATNESIDRKLASVQWFGAGNMTFTILLALAALLSRFGRKETDSLLI